jgi:soluble epoxide hydrolase / lipid-phosphate phosphatase
VPPKMFPVESRLTKHETDIPDERKLLRQPTLLITCAKDFIGRPEMQLQGIESYLPNLVVKSLNTSHWLQLEAPDEVNASLEAHFKSS